MKMQERGVPITARCLQLSRREFINSLLIENATLSGEFFDRECNSLSRRESRVSGDASLSGEWQQREGGHFSYNLIETSNAI